MRLKRSFALIPLFTLLIGLLPLSTATASGPTANTLPTISGTLAVGQTLTTTPGTWTPTPASYTYQWWRCSSQVLTSCSLIAGATNSTYTLTINDGGNFFYAQVTALAAGGGTTANSAITGRVLTQPTSIVLPAITGSVLVGTILSLSSGTWSGASSPVFTYQWQRCTSTDASGSTCVNIANAVTTSFTVTSAEVGFFLRGRISVAANAFNLAASAFSSFTNQISSEPITVAIPSITGLAAVDEELTATRGTFVGFPLPTFTQQWQSCSTTDITTCTPIEGATALTYTVKASDVGKYFRIMVTATNNLGVKGSPSALTAVAVRTALPANTAPPSISGTLIDRQILTLNSGTWTGVPTPTTTIVWQACSDASGTNCSDIPNATANTLKLSFANLGKYIRAKVTATNRIGAASSNSNILGPVVPATKLESPPSTFGFLQVGQEWIATPGTWSGALNPTFGYQWQRCSDDKGTNCVDIAGATKKEYTIQASDKGFYIRVKNWIIDQSVPAYSEILPVKITAPAQLPKDEASPTAKPKKVTKKRITITCIKGESTKRVSGKAPKCPKGFKKR